MEELLAAAFNARMNAYAPYSVYRVGAALRGADGQVYTGCNVENISFGATICAERAAILKMVEAGCRVWTELVVATQDGGRPCGLCLQVLAEFLPEEGMAKVAWADENGVKGEAGFQDLLPQAFRTQRLNVK